MAVVIELSVPGTAFALGRIIPLGLSATIELDRIVPTGGRVCPYLWVETADHAQFREAVEDNDVVEEFRLVTMDGDTGLYHLDWSPERTGFLNCLQESDAAVLCATGTTDRWEFELRFDSHDHVRQFQEGCSEREIEISIDSVTSGTAGESPTELLSPRQKETIALALERGYFDVPRQTTMVQLADELGISDQAVSARIRRGVKKLTKQEFTDSGSFDADRPEMTLPTQGCDTE